ncbi:MAG TPA: 4-(cytidine 5'-diphospho)-2-C-methyl-D-erythritol kinase [Candidatus Binataceae bacterium]|nr:4-(cytidine 5'-diphospho)-2-C-methyl-D-erythritol kinase [Candidatus Binataceae bacterium]
MVKLLAEPAPAKINLFLRVVGRRPDGYHELDSVFVPVSLCDQVGVEIRVDPRSAADTAIVLTCDRPVGYDDNLPTGEKNLAWRAAAAFLREFGPAIHRPSQVTIDLRKKIPAGAGLGGGSSDAGAVLRMMAALCRVEDVPRMARVALALGADVPFFLNPHPAHVGGVGERIAPLETATANQSARIARTPLHMVLAVAAVEVSTAEVFRALLPAQWSGAAPAEHLRAIAAGKTTPAMLQNDLAAVAMARYPEIAELRSALIAAGAQGASMSGSGGAVFGIFANGRTAAQAAVEMGRNFPQARYYVVNSLP